MSLRKIRAGRVDVPASTWVGQEGTIFYDEDTGTLRIADGLTPGGNPITLVASDFAFQFGDFVATTETVTPFGATLMSAQNNQDINIVSNGTGHVNVIGDFSVYKADGTVAGAMSLRPIFNVNADGQVRMLVPKADMAGGALEIVGNSSGDAFPPDQTGVILHVTGNSGLTARNYFDANNNYPILVGRRYNGTSTAVSKVLNGQLFFRIAGQASNDTGFQTFGPCQIDWVATEDQGPTNQGGELRIRATPNGSSSLAGIVQVAAFNATTGVTAIKFNGPLSGNVVATTVTATNFVGTVTTAAQPNITSVGTLTNLSVAGTVSATTGTFTKFSGKFIRAVRDAGTIGAGGTLTIDFATDALVHCVWSSGLVINYQNYTAGSIVKVMATKSTGSGNGGINLDGLTAANVSSGSTTTGNYSPDTTAFIEFTCMNTTIGSVYAKL